MRPAVWPVSLSSFTLSGCSSQWDVSPTLFLFPCIWPVQMCCFKLQWQKLKTFMEWPDHDLFLGYVSEERTHLEFFLQKKTSLGLEILSHCSLMSTQQRSQPFRFQSNLIFDIQPPGLQPSNLSLSFTRNLPLILTFSKANTKVLYKVKPYLILHCDTISKSHASSTSSSPLSKSDAKNLKACLLQKQLHKAAAQLLYLYN